MNIVLVARRKSILDTLATQLTKEYVIKTMTLELDLTKKGYLDALIQKTLTLDIGLLISNVRAGVMGAFIRNEKETLKSMLKLNVITQMELAYAFTTRFFERKKQSDILMVRSSAGLQGMPHCGNYSSAKAYIHCLGQSLNNKLKKHLINVSVLISRPTNTPGLTTRQDIDLSAIPGKVMSVSDVVNKGLNALFKNKTSHIVVIHNRLMISMIPRKVMIKTGGAMMKKHTFRDFNLVILFN